MAGSHPKAWARGSIVVGILALVASAGLAQAFAPAVLPTQSEGNRGEDVAAIQLLLLHHGFGQPPPSSGLVGALLDLLFGPPAGLAADGVFDAATDQAVRDFQASRGLAVDGIVGPNTWGALQVTLREGDSGDAVRALQRELNAKRGAGLAVDGDFDAGTEAAVVAFQSHAGIGADGIVGPITWRNLLWHFEQPTLSSDLCGYRAASARWGTAAAIGQLEEAARTVSGQGHGPVAMGDIALEHGGDIAGHVSHEVGLDADMRPMRTDQAQCSSGCRWDLSCYDRAATRDLAVALREAAPGHVRFILFNDPVLIDEGLTIFADAHDDHLHIRYCEAGHADSRYVC